MKNISYSIHTKALLLLLVLFLSPLFMSACQNDEPPKDMPAPPSDGTTMPSDVTPSQTSNVQIDGALGKLSAIVYRPELTEGDKVAMVILMHGFMSNKQDRVMTTIASELQKKRIAYIRFDFNGHGNSEGDFQNMTVANKIEDAKKVYDYARSLNYVGDIALLGHSQGGVVASMVAGELGDEKVSKLVLMAPAAVLKDNSLNGEMFGVRFDPMNIPEHVTVYGHSVGREYIKVAQTLPIYETAARYTGPVCIIHGISDEIVPYSYSERYRDGYKDAALHLVEDENHAFSRKLDEVTNIAADFLSKSFKTMYMNINITVNNSKVLEATLVDNSSSRALVERLQQGSVTYTSSPYGNFESVGDIGFTLPRNDTQTTTAAGDVILYQGHNICLYYATNSWNFTRLGRITNATQSELRNLLSFGNVTVTLSLTPTSDISTIKAATSSDQSKKGIFSLDGKRLENVPTKGTYIENGVKKVK